MGKTRVCGKQCHHAKTAKCRCWCGGTFHGSEGQAARELFGVTFSLEKLPTTERDFNKTVHPDLFREDSVDWRARVTAAAALAGAATTKKARKA